LSEVKNIHVCLVTISLGTGGAQRVVAAQTHMFAGLGYRVTTAVLRDPIDYAYAGELLHLGGKNSEQNSAAHPAQTQNEVRPNETKSWQRLWRLYRFIRAKQPEVIVDHRSRTNILKEWVYRKLIYRKARVVYVCHSAHAPIYLTNYPRLFSRITEKHSTHVGVSEHITEVLMAQNELKHRKFIPNFVAPEWLAVEHQTPEVQWPYLLWFGRLDDSVKDLSFLLDAFARSKTRSQGYKLLILGSGPDKDKLQQKTKALKIESSVVFLSFDPNPQALITQAKCVCLTSRYEGFPMALLEGLSLGTPVVSLDILSGPNELIQHQKNGLLVGERNSRIFAQAIDTLCLDEAFYKGVKANAQSSIEAYSSEQVSKQWKALIEYE
jgi:glycosyltransferase involved in cell wall biosynthesis